MAKVNTFRDLIVWQKGMALSKMVYVATRQMPREEQFGLTNQMRRAVVSVPSNIAEGYARGTTKDYLKHLRVSRGSLAELATQYELAVDLEMLQPNQKLDALLSEEARMLQFLIMRLQKRLRDEKSRKQRVRKSRDR